MGRQKRRVRVAISPAPDSDFNDLLRNTKANAPEKRHVA
jgi:hypothetical protein